jgi:hypothetical protein
MKRNLVHQLRHVDATPEVLNNLEQTTLGAVRHLYEVLERAAKEIERQAAEIRTLKKLCKQHGIDTRTPKP